MAFRSRCSAIAWIPCEVSASTLSIITPTFNRAPLLREALASVVSQGVADLEQLVIDGGSKDNTREVVAEFPHARLTSEPDRGIYDAMNKGLAAARGEIVGLLNSDDLYLPGALEAVREAFADPAVEVVSGGAEVFRGTGENRTVIRSYTEPARLKLSLQNLTFEVPVINARFFRRSVVERAGPMDLRYSIAADREFLFRVAMLQPREVVLGRTLYAYREHEESLTLRAHVPAATRFRAEHLDLAETYRGKPELSETERELFRLWHREESAILALSLALEGRLGLAWQTAGRGWRLSPDWPLAAAKCAAEAIGRRLRS